MMAGVLLLAGLFVAPALLLVLGHRLRERSPRGRRRFWWGVVGYLAGVLVALCAMLVPPVEWAGSMTMRGLAVFGSMPVGLLGGLVVGSLVPLSRPGREG